MPAHDRPQELVALRRTLGWSQATMAQQLDLAQRQYQAFEWGEQQLPDIYLLAVERLALKYAALQGNLMLLPLALREEAARLGQSSQPKD